MNNVSLIGRLTADPELKHTQSGLSFTRFMLAVDRQFVKQGEQRQADFISITAWRQTAEFICKYFGKGQRIALTGRIQTGSYTDQSGAKRYTFDVLAENVEFCESKKDTRAADISVDNGTPAAVYSQNDSGFMDMPNEEDLPF